MIYKLYSTALPPIEPNAAMSIDTSPAVSFLFDPANTDYQQFKTYIQSGSELQDADGKILTKQQALDFLATLP